VLKASNTFSGRSTRIISNAKFFVICLEFEIPRCDMRETKSHIKRENVREREKRETKVERDRREKER
jgi:hypothetical protein